MPWVVHLCEDVEGHGSGCWDPTGCTQSLPVGEGQRSTHLPAARARGSGGSGLQLRCLLGERLLLA